MSSIVGQNYEFKSYHLYSNDEDKYSPSNVYNDDELEEQMKTWQKIVSVLFWTAGVILIVVALLSKEKFSDMI